MESHARERNPSGIPREDSTWNLMFLSTDANDLGMDDSHRIIIKHSRGFVVLVLRRNGTRTLYGTHHAVHVG